MTPNHGMIEAQAPTASIRKSYNLSSHIYGWLAAPFERKPRQMGLERLAIQPSEKVLEVAVGPGVNLVEILARVDKTNCVCGIDLSPKMLAKARRRVQKAGHANIELQEGDARKLPFAAETFDVLFNSYMLDLIPLADLPMVLTEFKRVLKPGGRLALVNMSKPDAGTRTWWESLYRWTPKSWIPYLLGGCRPVLMEDVAKEVGFQDVHRVFVPHILPSEILTARKPVAENP